MAFSRWFSVAVWALALVGCGEAPAPPAAATVRFELGDDVPAFADVPFPSELYRDADGHIAVGAFPNPHDGGVLFDALRALLAERDGFCTSCNITFAIDGVDPADPAVDPAWLDPAALEEAAMLVDIDDDSPERGTSFPWRLQWDAERGLLSMRPKRGYTLHGGRRYAAVLTSNAAGGSLAAAPAFAALRDGVAGDAPSSARAHIASALAALESLSIARERVVGLASFTTEDPSAELIALRRAIHAAPLPTVAIDGVFSDSALDELLGIPQRDGPGVDRPPADGELGTRAVSHQTTAVVVAGKLKMPRFVEGSGADVGVISRDASGEPTARSQDDVPFVLIVPRDVDVSRLPVVVAQHGFNASRTTGFALADTAGRAGYAVLAIDAFQHGDRAASASDEQHSMRGDYPGPDGFAETNMLDVSSRMFGLSGGAPDMALFPGYALAAFEQFAADVMSATRWLQQGAVEALQQAHPDLADLAFDRQRIAFVGNSMGAVVGSSVVVAEPDIGAFVLDVMPGSIVETLCESGEFRPLSTTLLLPVVGVTGDFDEQTRALVFDPTVDLMRWVLEPIDPLALAPYLVRERPAAGAPDLLIQLAGHDEVAAPTASESVVAAAGIAGAGEFAFADVTPVSLPRKGERATVAAVRFEGAMHGMLEVRTQESHFEAPLSPPLSKTTKRQVENPTERVHRQIEVFLASHAQQGRSVIVP